jgi:hypothetical protein
MPCMQSSQILKTFLEFGSLVGPVSGFSLRQQSQGTIGLNPPFELRRSIRFSIHYRRFALSRYRRLTAELPCSKRQLSMASMLKRQSLPT